MSSANGMHPSERFRAPGSIEKGVPLKELLNRDAVRLIAESLDAVVPAFHRTAFERTASRGLDALELKQRAALIATAMAEQLPGDFHSAAPLLIRSFGPVLRATEGNGLAPFFYLPHSHYIATHGATDFDPGMQANYELTRRFTAEFSLRTLLVEHEARSLKRLRIWAKDSCPHVRRLVSEGTRPRLPWASRLPRFQEDPERTLPLLELLKNDDSLYVRRSVANHLGDLAKDHPERVFDVCERWLEEADSLADHAAAEQRRWIIRHAVRHPAKSGIARAAALRAKAAADRRPTRVKRTRPRG